MKEILLIDVQDIKNSSQIDNNVDDLLIRDVLLDVQESLLEKVLGTPLYERLLTDVDEYETNQVEIDPNYKTLLDKYVRKYLIKGVLTFLPQESTYMYRNAGLVKQNTDNFTTADFSEIASVRKQKQFLLDDKKERLQDYLDFNKAKFPEYCEKPDVGAEASDSASRGGIFFSKNAKRSKNNKSMF